MKGDIPKIGELQQKILKHIFECTSESENANHIAKSLGLAQPTVLKSIQLLMQENYMESQQKSKRTEKMLTLTEKGAAAAVLLGISNDEIINYFKRTRSEHISSDKEVEFFQKFKHIAIKEPDKQDLLIRKMMEYFLKNNYFDEIGAAKHLSTDEFKRLLTYVAIEYHNALGNPRKIRDLVDKYSLDKKQLKDILEKQKLMIDSMIRQLED
jgi:DNA-binding MarR family transcriptional regulator